MVGQACLFVLIFTSHINFAPLLQQPLPPFIFHMFLAQGMQRAERNDDYDAKGRLQPPKRMIFRKSSKGRGPPPTFFRILTFFFFQFPAQKALFKGPRSAT